MIWPRGKTLHCLLDTNPLLTSKHPEPRGLWTPAPPPPPPQQLLPLTTRCISVLPGFTQFFLWLRDRDTFSDLSESSTSPNAPGCEQISQEGGDTSQKRRVKSLGESSCWLQPGGERARLLVTVTGSTGFQFFALRPFRSCGFVFF
ncbi:unnamed protein product [Pleuronectes platessa]|uniref:Uncharacterized protein n=1 Tax=Pleuronectes platessa TaxID=8262 RepID=A0A9N7UMW3_PLEPL|nr:unnamed protein product [Pleuronectes platessa]